MVILGEVLSLATPRAEKRSLKNAFAANVDLKMLIDTNAHTKPQVHVLFCEYLYILLTRNSILSKIVFPRSH